MTAVSRAGRGGIVQSARPYWRLLHTLSLCPIFCASHNALTPRQNVFVFAASSTNICNRLERAYVLLENTKLAGGLGNGIGPMTRLVWPVFILLLMLLGGAAWSLFGPLNLREFLSSNTTETSRPTAEAPASKSKTGAVKTKEQAQSGPAEGLPAEFDIARIDPEGTSVFAGRTLPNASVTVMGDGREIGTAKADEQGEWTMAVDHKFASDDPELAIVAKRAPESNAPSEKQREAAEATSRQDAQERIASGQSTSPAPVADGASEGEARGHQKASSITTNLLKNLENMVETARTAAHQPTAIEPKDPVPAQTNDVATLSVAVTDAAPTVSQIRGTPVVPPPTGSPTVSSPDKSSPSLAATDHTATQEPVTNAAPPVRKTIPVPITFIFNEATLTEDGKKAAALLLEYLQIKKFPKVSLTGHADERGTDELNMALSRARLATVERFLRDSGFEGELELVPKGESEPFKGVERSEYELEDLYQLDRRVELIITR